MCTTQYMADPELLATEWDLAPLVDGEGETERRRLLEEATARAEHLRRVVLPAGSRARRRRPARGDAWSWRDLEDLAGSAASYASLRFSTDTADPARGALLAHMQEQATAISTKLLFFELEWAALDDEDARAAARLPPISTSAAITSAARGATGRTCSASPRRRFSPRRASPAKRPGRGCSAS